MRIASPLTTEPHPVLQWIEVASSLQIPSFHIIGLASLEVSEARERVRAAIESSGFDFPRRRVVINLSPASIRKRGTGSDLAIALSVLGTTASEKDAPCRYVGGIVASGELGLDGRVKPVGKVMRTLHAAWEAEAQVIFLSPEDFREAQGLLPLLGRAGIFSSRPPELVAVSDLGQAWEVLCGKRDPQTQADLESLSASWATPSEEDTVDLLPLSSEIEKWILIAAAGLHHLLLLGPRGAGKSHAFEWLIRLQPRASAENQVKQLLIRELSGSENLSITLAPPVRRVGTQVRAQALCGGAVGGTLRPGEFSLAHGGILIADELPEWPRDSREALREPLERGKVCLTRSSASAELPAQFVLAANGNLCPCGGWPRLLRKSFNVRPGSFRCICKDAEVSAYLKRLSGPVLDRIDIIQLVGPGTFPPPEKSASRNFEALRGRTRNSQEIARQLWGTPPGLLSSSDIERILHENPGWREILSRRSDLGMRSRHKLFRVALSLAIYEAVKKGCANPGEATPSAAHFEQAFYLRPEGIGLHFETPAYPDATNAS
jgi:magnesium chelatase family protein